jgi:hypothetical protein
MLFSGIKEPSLYLTGNTLFLSYRKFDVSMAVKTKNAAFLDIEPQFVLHRRHITSPLQSPTSSCHVRFDVLIAVTMKNAIFSDVMPCGSC